MTERHLNYIAGEWQPAFGGATFEDRNPADERDLIGLFPDSDIADVAAAVASVASVWPPGRRSRRRCAPTCCFGPPT